jgi:hypothetical protein
MVSIRKIIIGKIRAIERSPLALSSTVPPALDRITRRQFLLQFGERRRQLCVDRFRLDAGDNVRLHGNRRQKTTTPDRRLFELVLDARHLNQRDRLPIPMRPAASQRLQRLALLVG